MGPVVGPSWLGEVVDFYLLIFDPLFRVFGFFLVLLKIRLFIRVGSIHEFLEHFMDFLFCSFHFVCFVLFCLFYYLWFLLFVLLSSQLP